MMSGGPIRKRLHYGTVGHAFEFTSLRSELSSEKQGVGMSEKQAELSNRQARIGPKHNYLTEYKNLQRIF